MKNINQVCISGNVVKDSVLTGKVLSFTVACNEMRRNEEDEWVEYPNYFDCVIFGKFAETMVDYILKGTKVCIQGKLNQGRWVDDDDNLCSRIQVIVDNIETMQPKRDTDEKPKKRYSKR